MESEGIMTSEIPERTANQGVKGFAEIRCGGPTCSWSWNTHRAHVVIDLKRQKVSRIYKQKCKKCEHANEPTFPDLVFRKLVHKAIELEKKFRNPVLGDVDIDDGDDGDDGGRRGPPHDSLRCEKCEWGRTQCWTKK